MDRLRERLTLARQALASFEELTPLAQPTAVERDAAIKRFESAFEAIWKAGQRYLLVVAGDDVGSPKTCIRSSRLAGLFTDAEAERALEMADDRNLTVHTYNEGLADAMFSRLRNHADTLRTWLVAMEAGGGSA